MGLDGVNTLGVNGAQGTPQSEDNGQRKHGKEEKTATAHESLNHSPFSPLRTGTRRGLAFRHGCSGVRWFCRSCVPDEKRAHFGESWFFVLSNRNGAGCIAI